MNPMTNVKNVQKLNERELQRGAPSSTSWHRQYRHSAWLFIGGLPYDLTEGDVIAVFSQYGEIVNLNLVRDKGTGKSKGFCFLCYEDQRSTVLAVDNLNSIKILGRTLRVDHCEDYKQPKEHGDEDEVTKKLRAEGCAPKSGVDVKVEVVSDDDVKVEKTHKKHKKKKHKRKHKKETSEESSDDENVKVKKEKIDPGYEKYTHKRDDKRADKHDSKRSDDRDGYKHERKQESKRSGDRESDKKGKHKEDGSSDRTNDKHKHNRREYSDNHAVRKNRHRDNNECDNNGNCSDKHRPDKRKHDKDRQDDENKKLKHKDRY